MKTEIEGGYLISDIGGKGVPILFIHGYPLSSKIWDSQVKSLADITTFITVDLRGHGESFAYDGPYPMELLADDCRMVLENNKIKQPVVVCGHSMGGYVTLAMYRKYPAMIKGMILTSTRPGEDSQEGKKNRDASIKVALDKGPTAISDSMTPKLISPYTMSNYPELVTRIHEIMANTSTLGIVGALQGMRDRPDSTNLLGQIKFPVLIIHGEDDQLIPIKEAEAMHQQISGSRLVKIPNAGHLPNMEQSEVFNQAIREFLTSFD